MDIAKLRAKFPILKQKIYDKNLVYLDNAASAQKPQTVIDALNYCLKNNYSNIHRGIHYLSEHATAGYEDTRRAVQAFINAQRTEEIIFTKNATEAINLVAYSWGATNLKEGDEIILSILEHHANIIPWNFLRERYGVVLKFIPLDQNNNFNQEFYKQNFTNRTKLVAISHMSNVTGELLPAKKIVDIAHNHNVPVLLDGSQAAVHNKIDVQQLNCDWYCFTGHKIYGPTGVGVLYGKYNILENMPPFLGGGDMIDQVTTDSVTYAKPPFRFEAGTPAIAEVIALKPAIEFMQDIGELTIKEYEAELYKYFIAKMQEIKNITLYNAKENSSGIISFNLNNIHPHDLSTYLDHEAIAIRAGTHCAQPLMSYFNISSCARASLAVYNTFEEIDYFVDKLKQAQRFFNDF